MTTPGSRWAWTMLTAGDSDGDLKCAAPGSEPGAVLSVTELIAAKQQSSDLQRFGRVLAGIREQTSRNLIIRLETTEDALTLWALHLALDRRDVPPCLRWPANQTTAQAQFITLLADLLWFCRRHPNHMAQFRGWRTLMKLTPASPDWHRAAHRQFLFVAARHSVAHWCSRGLNLNDAHRADLMALQTNTMRANRRGLEGRQHARLLERLESNARARPDKSGRVSAVEVAARRALIWRTYVLAGRSPSRAVAFWRMLSGEELTRQALSKQIAIVTDVLRSS